MMFGAPTAVLSGLKESHMDPLKRPSVVDASSVLPVPPKGMLDLSGQLVASGLLHHQANFLNLGLHASKGIVQPGMSPAVQQAFNSQVEQKQKSSHNVSKSADDSLSRLRKRRIQVAEASRRSRAKRKKEFSSILERNELLQSEVATLKKRLATLEKSASSRPETKYVPADSADATKVCKENTEMLENSRNNSDSELQKVEEFLKVRAKSYFEQLRQDYKLLCGGTSVSDSSTRRKRMPDFEISFNVQVKPCM
mmetsp:Transcript_15747/g.17776  ORF Transcript_15747/g.17776 Transcript_15747/m.17776 type:complete len:253 (+) Transcript_15747:180-938(+)